jgi:hypothetical protein
VGAGEGAKQMKTINNELIRSFKPCYDPSTKGIPDNETLTVKEWVEKYRGVVPVSDILWLLVRNEFYTDKQLRLFAAWCARKALKLYYNPDQRSIDAARDAWAAAWHAARDAWAVEWDVAWAAALHAARDARDAARDARDARDAAWDAARDAQLNYLLAFES